MIFLNRQDAAVQLADHLIEYKNKPNTLDDSESIQNQKNILNKHAIEQLAPLIGEYTSARCKSRFDQTHINTPFLWRSGLLFGLPSIPPENPFSE
jgi:hypothetical protein